MGDRALIVFKATTENLITKKTTESISPAVYLHWQGSSVERLLQETMDLMERRNDLDYVAARFINVCCMDSSSNNLSVGVNNVSSLAEAYSSDPGDHGVFVVDVTDPALWVVENNHGRTIELE